MRGPTFFKLFLTTSCIFSVCMLCAQDWSIALIPDSLMESADAVVRVESGVFSIKKEGKASLKTNKIVTVLNDKAKDQGVLAVRYDKLSSVTELAYSVFDQFGKRVFLKTYGESLDRSAISNATLYDDQRIKIVTVPEHIAPPYTVHMSYKRNFNFLYFIPTWYFVDSENTSVQRSDYMLSFPDDIGARFKEQHFSGNQKTQQLKGRTIVSWTMSGIKARKFESYGPPISSLLPSIIAAPKLFDYDGYKGDMSTWDGFSDWLLQLSADLDELPEEFVRELKNITAGMGTLKKSETIYTYLQEHSRYVSIQLGIGGFQPFSPKLVHETGYGDCKALTYYTKAMLEAVGVKSHYTLVSSGKRSSEIDMDFPRSTFNHVILCIPNESDSIWLECTTQSGPFNYLGSFTGNRQAFLLSETGSGVVNTKQYLSSENIKETSVEVQLFADNPAIVQVHSKHLGVEAEELSYILGKTEEEQLEFLKEYIPISTFKSMEFDFDRQSAVYITLNARIDNAELLKGSFKRMFFEPNMFTKNDFVPVKNADRQNDIVIRYGYTERDSVTINLPVGYEVEAMFTPVKVDSPFGTYEIGVKKLENGQLLCTRYFTQKTGVFSPDLYQEFIDFNKKVTRGDKKKVAIVPSS